MKKEPPNVFVLTGVYDDQYLRTRKDRTTVCTSAGKRITLYRAIEQAAGKPLVLLSPQPRGHENPQALPACISRFGSQIQLFSKASGVRKIRFLLDIVHYARHVAKHTRSGDTVIIDTYELIYVIALYYCRLMGRKNRILLEYEDGKHLIDKGIWKWMSGLAEWLARPLVEGAILATPTLGERLPNDIPKICVPGILNSGLELNPPPPHGQPVCFLYSGSLDHERGIPLLLDYLEGGNFPHNANIHITGQGHFVDRFLNLQARYPSIVYFHGSVSQEKLKRIRKLNHYGLNLQSASNPISTVTYPSKTFDYVNAGLRVLSTRAAGVEEVMTNAAIYLQTDTVEGLGILIHRAIQEIHATNGVEIASALEGYSFDGTVKRLAKFF